MLRPDLAEAVEAIQKVASGFVKDVRGKETRYPTLLNLLILNTLHEREGAAITKSLRREALEHPETRAEDDVITEGARYVRFASAAYGLFMLKGLGIMSDWPPLAKVVGIEADRWVIATHTGVGESNLVKLQMTGPRNLHLPAYYIAVDHESKSIVLAIRGTRSVSDAITDLVCGNAEYLDGQAHHGMSRGAALVLEDAKETLTEQLAAHPGYRLVLCGHSMGGGVATLLTLHLERHPAALGVEAPVVCFAYGPPPVYAPSSTAAAASAAGGSHGGGGSGKSSKGSSRNEAGVDVRRVTRQEASAIHSFVYRHDIVPRLSLASAFRLFETLRDIDELPVGLRRRTTYLLKELRPHVSVERSKPALGAFTVKYRLSSKVNKDGEEDYDSGVWQDGETVAAMGGGKDGKLHSERLLQAFVRQHYDQDLGPWEESLKARARAAGGENASSNDSSASSCKEEGAAELRTPGHVYWLGCSNGGGSGGAAGGDGSKQKQDCVAVKVPAATFDKILLVDTAVLDHPPSAYEAAFRGLRPGGSAPSPQ